MCIISEFATYMFCALLGLGYMFCSLIVRNEVICEYGFFFQFREFLMLVYKINQKSTATTGAQNDFCHSTSVKRKILAAVLKHLTPGRAGKLDHR